MLCAGCLSVINSCFLFKTLTDVVIASKPYVLDISVEVFQVVVEQFCKNQLACYAISFCYLCDSVIVVTEGNHDAYLFSYFDPWW